MGGIANYPKYKMGIDERFEYAMSWDIDMNVKNLVEIYGEIINE